MQPLNYEQLEAVKRLAVLAMISDDTLMELLYFKGGSALSMIYGISDRASLDLDFSMAESLTKEEEADIDKRINHVLQETFAEEGYVAYDVKFLARPRNMPEELQEFWGGYQVKFKVTTKAEAERHGADINRMRSESMILGDKNKRAFKIDISAHEYCEPSVEKEYEDYTIQVYTEEMIVFEKLRALCQQLDEYREIVPQTPRARGRDYHDIYVIMHHFDIDPTTEENRQMIRNIFAIKKVPLDFIGKLRGDLESHRENFETSVRDTVRDDGETPSFDECAEFVLATFEPLEW